MYGKAMTATAYKSTDIPCYNSIDPCLLFSRGNSIFFLSISHSPPQLVYLQLSATKNIPGCDVCFFRLGLFLSLHKCMVRV